MNANEHKSIYAKYLSLAKKDGYLVATKQAIFWITCMLRVRKFDAIQKRRIEISKQLDELFKSTVRYGPFKGLKLSTKTWWGLTDRGSMLLGLYEKEVLDSLQNIPKKFNTFIDLGAADGYYGIGVLVNNLFEKSICYEISEEGRQTIKDNAQLNNVLHKVEIRGIAKNNFYHELSSFTLSNTVLFIDIEGAEFELIGKETFNAFNRSIIFIELHDWFFEDGEEKLLKIKNDSTLTHVVTELTMGSRDLSIFPELNKLHDNDRWLICSEGRGQLMTWLRFDPK
ncbi:FkbM family methyltransferase [Spirobacillus cienkowskii]|uniref:FkbM family methyltransferase n=1 Tax=Spirobacillus cienkowskii TaxID=495820 RepID=UPI0030D46EE5